MFPAGVNVTAFEGAGAFIDLLTVANFCVVAAMTNCQNGVRFGVVPQTIGESVEMNHSKLLRAFAIGGVVAIAVSFAPVAFAEQAPGSTPPAEGHPASAPSDSTAARTPTPPAPGSPDEVVCKTEKITGSRLGATRICKTRRDWGEIEKSSQQAVSNMQDHQR